MRLPQNAGSVPFLRMMRASSSVRSLAYFRICDSSRGVMLWPVEEYMGLVVSGLGCSGTAMSEAARNDRLTMRILASALWINIWFSPAGMIAE